MNGSVPPADSPACGYRFADFRLGADGTLLRGNRRVPLTVEEITALRLLVERAGDIVSPLELKRLLGRNAPAATDSAARCVASLRARLEPSNCIQSVYKRGFRISATVRRLGLPQQGDLPRLVILPFAAGYGIPEYLGTAVAQEAMVRLEDSNNPIASIVAPDSVFALATRRVPAHQIGQTLRADLVLTGELKATTKRDRIRIEMMRVEDGAQLWIEEFFFDRRRIAVLVQEVVKRVSCRLHGGGLFIAAAADEKDQTDLGYSEAIDLFQRARFDWQSLERHRMQDGMSRLRRAIELDPTSTPAWVDLAHLCVAQGLMGFMAPMAASELLRRAMHRIPKGTEIAERMRPALGWMNFHVDRDLRAANREFARVAHLDHDPWVTRLRVVFALSRHRFNEALELLQEAIAVDPYSPWLQARLGWALHLAGETSASAKQIRKTLEIFPGHTAALLYGSIVLSYNGETARALELAQKLGAEQPNFDIATAVHAYALARAGNAGEARTLLERLEWLSRERFVMNTFQAAVYVELGDPDAALRELHASNRCRCPWFFQTLADPRLEPLHRRAEFEAMRTMLTGMEAEASGETA